MTEQLEKFDPSTLMQGVKDRIKATFVSLIPDPQWDQIVQKEIDAFFAPQKFTRELIKQRNYVYTGSGDLWIIKTQGDQSPFQAMVWDFCIDATVISLKKIITQEYFDEKVGGLDFDKNSKLAEVVAAAIPSAITNFFTSFAEKQMSNLKNDLINHRIL